MKRIDKEYVSNIDKQLKAFDQKHPNSASQQAEIDKYQEIYRRRDQIVAIEENETDIWE